MSDLVERVRLAITLQSHITMTDADAHTAIRAVAEWLGEADGQTDPLLVHAAIRLEKQLEDKR